MRLLVTKISLSVRQLALLLVVCMIFTILGATPSFSASHTPPGSQSSAAGVPWKSPNKRSLHSPAWFFGQSPDRHDDLWCKGVNAKAVKQRAVPSKLRKDAMDTSSGIKRALNEVKKVKKGSVGLSMGMGNRASTWKVEPNGMRADEFKPRDSQHVVRAFADVKANDDLNIKIGPELILRDESLGEENAHEKQPDTSVGVGMHFKYNF